MIDTVDKYIPLYAYEKTIHPEKEFVWRQFRKKDITDVDKIVEISRGNRETIKKESDWVVVEHLLRFFYERWPEEFKEFKTTIPDIRKTRNNKGYSKSKEIMYVGALPQRFMRLIKVVFPYQQFDKKFIYKLVKRFPLFKVAGEGN